MTCSVLDCARPKKCRGFCENHYRRFLKYGDPLLGGTSPGAPMKLVQEVIQSNTDECIIWPFNRSLSGYAHIAFRGSSTNPCRLICAAVHGDPPTPEHHAAHSCGHGSDACVNPRHLRWKTPKENDADKDIHGTRQRGEKNGISKITEQDARDILRRFRAGETQTALAAEYGIIPSNVSSICCRKTWKHVVVTEGQSS